MSLELQCLSLDERLSGDYQPVGSFDSLVGCTLDGAWSIKVTDLWGADNGYIFGWSLDFNPAIIQDCSIW